MNHGVLAARIRSIKVNPAKKRLVPDAALAREYRDAMNYWRNVWLYSQRMAGKTNGEILQELKTRAAELDFYPLETNVALRRAIDSIAQFHDWPRIRHKPGRPPRRENP